MLVSGGHYKRSCLLFSPAFLPSCPGTYMVTQQVVRMGGACMIVFAQCLLIQGFGLGHLNSWKQAVLKVLTCENNVSEKIIKEKGGLNAPRACQL